MHKNVFVGWALPLLEGDGALQRSLDPIYTVSKKTVPTYFLLYVCQMRTDFNKNWKDCPGRNP